MVKPTLINAPHRPRFGDRAAAHLYSVEMRHPPCGHIQYVDVDANNRQQAASIAAREMKPALVASVNMIG